MGRFTRTLITIPLWRFSALMLLVSMLFASSAYSAPTFGFAPLFSGTSFRSPLASYDFEGELNPHVGLGGSANLTFALVGTFGARIHAGAIYFPAIQETYLIPDNNPFEVADGTIDVERSLKSYQAGLEILFSINHQIYGLVGGTYYSRTWKNKEWGTLPTKFTNVYEEVDLSSTEKTDGIGIRIGLGTRLGRRTSVEANMTADSEMLQIQLTLNYLIPLTFLSSNGR